jgi:K+-sensing histidine kinase KdpD
VGIEWFRRYRGRLRLIAVFAPLAVAGGLYLVRGVFANSAAALVLVLVVVGCAATGDRASGLLASLASAAGFSFFLTAPYLSLRIDNAEDLQLTVLLLLISSAVTELALWGVRQAARASRQAGFVRGVLESADLAAGVARLPDALERVSESIRKTLGAERVSFEYGEHDSAAAVINRDGSVRCRGVTLDVTTDGLPIDRHTVIPVAQHGAQIGYFQVTTATTLVRPSVEQLRVAVLLAVQWSLGALTPRPPRSRVT